MAWSQIQGNAGSQINALAVVGAISPPTVGNLLILVVGFSADAGTPSVTVADAAGNTWTQAIAEIDGVRGVAIFYAPCTATVGSGTLAITATGSTGGGASVYQWAYWVGEYSGLATSSVLDQTASDFGAGGAADFPITPTLGSLVIGAGISSTTGVITGPTGWANLASVSSPAPQNLDAEQSTGTGSTLTPSWSPPSGDYLCSAAAASFLLAPGSPPTASVSGSSTLTGTGTVTVYAAATLASTTTLPATGLVNVLSAPLASTTTIYASGTVTVYAAATLASTTTLPALLQALEGSTLASTTTLGGSGTVTIYAVATLTSTGTIAATGETNVLSAILASTTTLTATGLVNVLSAILASTTTLTAVGSVPSQATATLASTTTLSGSGILTVPGSTLAYTIYGNNGADGPVDYTTVIGLTAGTSWSTTPLAAGTWKFGVRTLNQTTLLGERNLDAVVTIVVGPTGTDLTNVPLAPLLVTAMPAGPGAVSVTWFYPLSATRSASKPQGFKVYEGTPTVSFISPVATIAYTPSQTFRATLTGLTAGSLYQIVVRAYNASGDDGNDNIVTVTPVAGGPGQVTGLVAILTNAAGT
jgi:autotransporter passenger strand-loop-strand repeat protein